MSWVRSFASAAVSVINQQIPMQVSHCIGERISDDGMRVPSYAPPQTMMGSAQPASSETLKMAEGMNLQGVFREVRVDGPVRGIDRGLQLGGDLLDFPAEIGQPVRRWLVVAVVEAWPTWTHVLVRQQ